MVKGSTAEVRSVGPWGRDRRGVLQVLYRDVLGQVLSMSGRAGAGAKRGADWRG